MVAAGIKTTAILLFALTLGCALYAQSSGITPAPAAPLNGDGVFHSTISLKEMGLPESVVFRGVDSSRAIPFSLPPTAVPEQAMLKLQYAFSPGLLGEMSHLSVLLNGELVATIPAPQNSGNVQQPLSTTIALPVKLLARNNTLGFEFIGHYTHGCEDPAHTTLWARVETASTLELTGSVLSLGNDLKMLPSPFYDGSTGQGAASLPFYFASAPGEESLEAAGIVASWFGVLAKSRPFRFPVNVGGDLPKGNFVLFADKVFALPGDLDLHTSGSTIAVRANPVDPYGKVLVIAGENPNQLLTAARALAAGNSVMQGDTARVNNFTLPAPRSADDAPLWLRTDRASPLWENVEEGELQGDGSGPLPVYVRVPPDLYFGDRQHLPMHLDYRYNTISLAKSSSLRVSANGSLVSELPLPHDDKPKKALSYDAQVPLVSMRPFANTFLFTFYFQLAKTGACQDTPPIDLQGGILRSSYLDLRGLKHWVAMPNLELFANAGFPFTRFADLSQTTIVLPPQAGPEEIELYLSLLAYFSEQTGYPALRVHVTNSLRDGEDSDELILGTPNDQPAFAALNAVLPVHIKENGFSIANTEGFFSTVENAWWQVAEMRPNWWWRLNAPREQKGVLDSISQFPDALIQGVEAPWSKDRSVVTITLKDKDAVDTFAAGFWQSSMSGDIGQSVSVLHGSDFSSYRLGSSFYHVGDLPLWSRVRYNLRTFPWLIVLLTFVLGLFVVPWTRMRLDNRVRERLEGHQI